MSAEPRNDRPPLTHDLDRCGWHPARESVGWTDVLGEDGRIAATVGACEECIGPRMPVFHAADEEVTRG